MRRPSARDFQIPLLLIALVVVFAAGCSHLRTAANDIRTEGPPMIVAASGSEIGFRFPADTPLSVRIHELEPWEVFDRAEEYPQVWKGTPFAGGASIRRVAPDGRDRLYRQFLLVNGATGQPIGVPQFVTDLSAVPARTNPLLFPEEIKGLTTVVDNEDGLNLGIKHTNSGLDIGMMIDWRGHTTGTTQEVDGIEVPINATTVSQLDQTYSWWTERGVLYTPILINLLPPERDPRDPLIHPQTDMENQPMGLGAFDMTDAEGVRAYIAAVEFLVERYTRENAEHGQIAALIIGNELQAHWTWHNMGNAPEEQVIREYTLSLRLADLAARSIHRDFKIYNSMTHHWSMRGYLNDPLKEISGIDLLDGILDQGKAQGDFPWHVAFHPYPENLFEPAFWEDKTATLRFDAPRVTFKNIEVLGAWLAQDRYLYNGQPRRVMFSEQGFHEPETPDGEEVQAAAYALSYVKSRQMPTLDAYHLHRHAHHPHEGGLRLGVVDADFSPETGEWTLTRRLKIYDVFQAAGTPRQDEAFAFALDVIGIDSWDDVAYRPDLVETEMHIRDGEYLFDLFDLADTAVLENIDRLYYETLIRDGGFPANAIFQHPPPEGDGRATFTLDLPGPEAGETLALVFDTAMKSDQSEDGVEFRIEIDGTQVFSHRQKAVPPVAHRIDLAPYGGTTVRLTLITNPIGTPTNDWSLWVQPRVVVE